ncbi:uncharacterized protein TNCV_4203561 [Trichonephila clavipes]|uniref:Mutator-like transposase domain-containing protein n=1 Tax=Trichonephila clavipes TaxID=2585209 RepID=A0A8X6VIC2_TRICX|nr:uncharacterized protein TNCV_4203561 [Trichonephila clavipes]
MSSKLSDGKSIEGKGRLTDRMIDLITTYYGNAIRQNKTCLSDMRKAVWAVYFHIRSSDEEPLHSFCPVGPNSWCKYQNQVVWKLLDTVTNCQGQETMDRRKGLSTDAITNLLREISEKESDCSNLDSDEDIRLSESDCEESD